MSDQGAAIAAKLDGAVTYDRNADGSVNKSSVTLGGESASGGTIVHNVADGVAASDAVNVGQLDAAISGAVNNAVVNAANLFFSGEGNRDTEGAISSGVHSVAGGANAQATGTNASAIGANSWQAATTRVQSARTRSRAATTRRHSVRPPQQRRTTRSRWAKARSPIGRIRYRSAPGGQERQITNVAAGVQGTDAVNVNQLQQSVSGAVGEAHNYTDDQIRSARRDSYGGTASALAMAGLPQLCCSPRHGRDGRWHVWRPSRRWPSACRSCPRPARVYKLRCVRTRAGSSARRWVQACTGEKQRRGTGARPSDTHDAG